MRTSPSSSQEPEVRLDRLEPDCPSLQSLVEHLEVGVWAAMLRDGRVQKLYVNPAFEKIWGCCLERLCRDPASGLAVVHPDDRDRLPLLQEKLLQGRSFQAELRLLRPGGELRWLELRSWGFLPGQDNGAALLAGSVTDITARRRVAAAREESEARRAALLACPALGMALMSPDGKILESNRVFQDLLGQGGEVEEELRRLAKTLGRRQEEFGQVEKRYLRRDGQTAWARLTATLIRDEKGKPLFSVNLVENITGHRRAEEALKQSRERFRLLYDKAPLGYQSLDEYGHCIDVNQTWLDILGYAREEVIGRWFGYFLAPPDKNRLEGIFARLQEQGEINDVELDMVRRDGSGIAVSLNARTACDEQGGFKQVYCIFADITARKQTEAALRQSEIKYRTLVEQIPAITYTARVDEFSTKLFLSPQVKDLLGFSLSDYQADPDIWRSRLHPEDRERVLAEIAQSQATGEAFKSEYRMVAGDGRIVWLQDEARVVRDLDGRPLVLQGVILDTTARKQAEAAVAQSEQKYRVLVNTLPAVVFRGYNDWTLDLFDDKIQELTGYPKEDFNSRQRRWCDVILPEDLEQVRRAFVAALKTTKSYVREYRIRNRSGKILWVQARGQIICGEDGEIDYVSGVLFDITREKEMEQLLAAEKERLAVTLRSIGDGVIATDTQGNIVLMNGVAEQLTGWTQQEALGRPVSQVFALVHEQTGTRCEDPVEQVIRGAEVVTLANSTHLVARDGTARSLAASGAPIVDTGGRMIGVVLVFRDITSKRQTEAELLKMEKLSSLAILAGGIAHDFNNILTGILGNISLAALTVPEGDHAIAPRLAEAERATLRARDLVQQLLTFAKGGAPVKELASLTEIIRESATFACRGSQVRAEFALAPDLWPGEVDTSQISQVIQNLTINAVQAMPAGGIVEVSAANVNLSAGSSLPLAAGRYVKICVRDHGVGIPPEHLAKIFDPYYSTKQKGSGLGLATAYSIITNHDGYMTVESKLGEGTAFYLYLPASHRELRPKRKSKAEVVHGNGKILVMDDDDGVREVAGRILAHLGYQPDYARDGEEAIKAYSTALAVGDPFDAVIMDLTIPGGMGGKEAIEKLRQLNPEARAIVSSGYADDPIMTNYRKYGFSGVIKKPYRVNAFSKELRRVLARH